MFTDAVGSTLRSMGDARVVHMPQMTVEMTLMTAIGYVELHKYKQIQIQQKEGIFAFGQVDHKVTRFSLKNKHS